MNEINTNDISIELNKHGDKIECIFYTITDGKKNRINLKAVKPDLRKSITREFYSLFVQGSKEFAKNSTP